MTQLRAKKKKKNWEQWFKVFDVFYYKCSEQLEKPFTKERKKFFFFSSQRTFTEKIHFLKKLKSFKSFVCGQTTDANVGTDRRTDRQTDSHKDLQIGANIHKHEDTQFVSQSVSQPTTQSLSHSFTLATVLQVRSDTEHHYRVQPVSFIY